VFENIRSHRQFPVVKMNRKSSYLNLKEVIFLYKTAHIKSLLK